MRFALMIEPQKGLTYEEQLAIARRAEANGFETLFRSDHYESFPGPVGRHTTDAWAVLAGLARETRIGSGSGALVSPVTFRYPGNLAKVVVTVDEMSGGRVEVGLGAGWHEDEHRRHGSPVPARSASGRTCSRRQLAIVHGLWDEPDGWSFKGRHVAIKDALFRPKPVAVPAGRSARTARPGRTSSSAGPAHHAAPGSRPAGRTSSTLSSDRPRSRRPTRSWTPPVSRSGATRPRSCTR